MTKIFIYGGGGHARVVVDCLLQQNALVKGIIDSKYEGDLYGIPRFKSVPEKFRDHYCVVAIGDNKIRKDISVNMSNAFYRVAHSSAVVSTRAVIGHGSMILHHAIVQAGASIGDHVIVNTGAQVDHDCKIADYVHIAPGSILCGTIAVGEGTLIGAGAVIKPGIQIGSWATIGSGTVVVKDVPDNAVVVGNPGRVIKFLGQ